jgi:hypothetical protein
MISDLFSRLRNFGKRKQPPQPKPKPQPPKSRFEKAVEEQRRRMESVGQILSVSSCQVTPRH